MTGYLGKQTKLQCHLLGHPTPKLQWVRSPPAPLPSGRHDLEEDGLIINSTEFGDTGVYICKAKNQYGSILQGTYLEVKPIGKYKISVRLLFTSRKLFSLSRHTCVVQVLSRVTFISKTKELKLLNFNKVQVVTTTTRTKKWTIRKLVDSTWYIVSLYDHIFRS